jgi:hypothetical protein
LECSNLLVFGSKSVHVQFLTVFALDRPARDALKLCFIKGAQA